MPELPEVETTRAGLEPHLKNQCITSITIRQAILRYPIPRNLQDDILDQEVLAVDRRGKYLIFRTRKGDVILHLGMSGSVRILEGETPAGKHDHFDWQLSSGKILRYNDPRRFGMLLWSQVAEEHELLARLGPEPLESLFDGQYLHQRARGRHSAIKQFIMDSHIVVGVGNIYASESLFLAGISPLRKAGNISLERYHKLAQCIRTVLSDAIAAGGTTLRDFTREDGKPGYFQQSLKVYGRENQHCPQCSGDIRKITQGQRSTYYCPYCQH